MVERIDRLDHLEADGAQHPLDGDLLDHLAHHGAAGAGMRLMAGHGGGGVVEDAHGEVGLVVEGVHHTRDAAREERGVAHEGEARRIGLGAVDALRDGDAGAHAEARVDHVERARVAQRVAADIAAEDGLAASHGLLDGVEARAVRASRAEHGRTHGELRDGSGLRRRSGLLAEERLEGGAHGFHGVLAGGLDIARELAADPARDTVLAAHPQKRPLDHGVELLHAEHLVEPLEELERELLGKRERRDYAQQARARGIVKVVFDVCEADAVRRDSHARGIRASRDDVVAGIRGELVGEKRIALLDLGMVGEGEAREDDPARRILDESLGLEAEPFVLVGNLDGLVAVVDARGGTEEHWASDALR